jgi:hypothetical protein
MLMELKKLSNYGHSPFQARGIASCSIRCRSAEARVAVWDPFLSEVRSQLRLKPAAPALVFQQILHRLWEKAN